jgi:hypothetical protein
MIELSQFERDKLQRLKRLTDADCVTIREIEDRNAQPWEFYLAGKDAAMIENKTAQQLITLRAALAHLYQKYVVDLHGEGVCDCDPSVGIDTCAPCEARAALDLFDVIPPAPGEGRIR